MSWGVNIKCLLIFACNLLAGTLYNTMDFIMNVSLFERYSYDVYNAPKPVIPSNISSTTVHKITDRVINHALDYYIQEALTQRKQVVDRMSINLNTLSWPSGTFPETENIIYFYPTVGGYTLSNAFWNSGHTWGEIEQVPPATSNFMIYPILPVAYPQASSRQPALNCTNYRLGDSMVNAGQIFGHIELWTIHCDLDGWEFRGNTYISMKEPTFIEIFTFIIRCIRIFQFLWYNIIFFETYKKRRLPVLPIGPLQFMASNMWINVADSLVSFSGISTFFKFDRMFFMEGAPWEMRISCGLVILQLFSSIMLTTDEIFRRCVTRFLQRYVKSTQRHNGIQFGNWLRPEVFMVFMMPVFAFVVERMNTLTVTSGALVTHKTILTVPRIESTELCETGHSLALIQVCFLAMGIRMGLQTLFTLRGFKRLSAKEKIFIVADSQSSESSTTSSTSSMSSDWSQRSTDSNYDDQNLSEVAIEKKRSRARKFKTNQLEKIIGPVACLTYGRCFFRTKVGVFISYEAAWTLGYIMHDDNADLVIYSQFHKSYMKVTHSKGVATGGTKVDLSDYIQDSIDQFTSGNMFKQYLTIGK